jgi:hypothetical protein
MVKRMLEGAKHRPTNPPELYRKWGVLPILEQVAQYPTNDLVSHAKRTLMLLVLFSVWRPRSDIGRITLSSIEFETTTGKWIRAAELPTTETIVVVSFTVWEPKGSSRNGL